MENLKRSWKVMEFEELKRGRTLEMNVSVLHRRLYGRPSKNISVF